jgi:hypothetical protein
VVLDELINTAVMAISSFIGYGDYAMLDAQRLQFSPSSACVQHTLWDAKRGVRGYGRRVSLSICY